MTCLIKSLLGLNGEHIPPETALRRIDQGAILIDVREADAFHLGHVPGARLLPLSRLRAEGPQLIDTLGLPEETTEVLLICQKGVRSRIAQGQLSGDRHRRYVSVDGGMARWKKAGLPIQTH